MSRRRKMQIELWGEGKPRVLVMCAHVYALSCYAAYECCRRARECSRVDGEGGDFPLAEWGALYERPVEARDMLLSGMVCEGGFAFVGWLGELGGDGEGLDLNKALSAAIGGELARYFGGDHGADIESVYTAHLDQMRRFATGNDTPRATWLGEMDRPEVQFLGSVAFPCMIEYGVNVSALFQEACNGKRRALYDLLRLDKRCLENARIRRRFYQAAKERAWGLGRAVRGRPRPRLSVRKVKRKVGRLILDMFARWDTALTRMGDELGVAVGLARVKKPHVVALFDAFARDFESTPGGGRVARDEDWPEKVAGVHAALHRERGFWKL